MNKLEARFGFVVLFTLLITSLSSTESRAVSPTRPSCEPLSQLLTHVAQENTRSRCGSFKFTSESLRREISVTVILPVRFTAHPAAPYPYAVYLHGRGGDENQLLDFNVLNEMDKVAEHYLIFAPAGGDHYWMNAARSGEKWGDLVSRDLLDFVEAHFPVAKGDSCQRALFGISMGGHGVLSLGLKHPDLFCNALAESPVFRREQDIWHPDHKIDEPPSDDDAFGEGRDYKDRSPRELCQRRMKIRTANGDSTNAACAGHPKTIRVSQDGPSLDSKRCLPFANFHLSSGVRDPLLDRYPDTRIFIQELAHAHPEFSIQLETCRSNESTPTSPEIDGHSATYWRCQMERNLKWIGNAFTQCPQTPTQTKSNH